MEPTYKDLAQALKKLNFKDKSTKELFVYVNEEFDSIVVLNLKSNLELVHKAHFAALSHQLEQQGVIKHQFDLGKMIEKDIKQSSEFASA